MIEEINGIFWIGDNSENIMDGTLYFGKDSKVLLKLTRPYEKINISSMFDEFNFKYIFGKISNNKSVTLINANMKKTEAFDNIQRNYAYYEPQYLVYGEIDEIKELDIEFENLFNFGLEIDWSSEVEFEKKFVTLWDNRYELSFVSIVEEEIKQNSILRKVCSKVRIRYEEGLSVLDWMRKIYKLKNYFELIYNINLNILSIKNKELSIHLKKEKIENLENRIEPTVLKNVLLKHDEIIKNWNSNYHKKSFEIYNYLKNVNVAVEVKLLLLTSAYESYFDFKFTKKDLLLTDRMDTFILANLKKRPDREQFPNQISLWEKIEAIINIYWDDKFISKFNGKKELEDLLIDRGVTIRNEIVHGGKNSKISDFYNKSEEAYIDDLTRITFYYQYFLKFILLKTIVGDIDKYVEETFMPIF